MKRFLLVAALLFGALPLRAQTAPLAPGATVAVPTLTTLRERYNALARRINTGQAPADPQNYPLLRFKLEQARLWIYQVENGLTTFPEDMLKQVDEALSRAEIVAGAQGDAVFPAPSQVHERAYVAASDGSVQPYWVYVPKGYTPKNQYPLAVFLHGYSPYISKVNPWVPDEATWSLFTERGFILAVPYGRRNTDFVGVGEDDTVIVTESVKARYSVDPNRVFLMGASMGGYGVYAVGLHRPDLWAGLSAMSGRTDFYLWFKLDRANVPWWKQLLYDANDPRHLADNAYSLPIFLQHGAQDTLNDPEQSRRFYNDLKTLGYPVRYREVQDGDHYIYFEADTYVQAIEWAAKVTRQSAPKRVVYTSGDLRNHRAYWARIEGFEDYTQSAHLEAEIKPGNQIAVTTRNVARFVLEPPAALLKNGQAVTLTVNGAADARQFAIGQPIAWPAAEGEKGKAENDFPGVKSPRRCGPIKNAYRDPFLLVYGTLQEKPGAPPLPEAADKSATLADRTWALRFAREWSVYADGYPRLKADKDVTADDRKNFNLILFGTRASNSILAEIAEALPLELLPDGYRLGKETVKVEKPKEIGLQFCYASPFDARRLVVVQSGLFWGDHLPANHKFDLLPDYIVFDGSIEAGAQTDHFDLTDQTNHALACGFFDGKWQLAPPKAAPPAPANGTARP